MLRYDGWSILLVAEENRLQVPDNFLEGVQTSMESVHYELPGCSGDVYLDGVWTDVERLMGETYAVGYDNLLWRSTDVHPPAGSVKQSESRGPGHCEDHELGFAENLHFGEAVVDLDNLFTPPYHLE